MTGRDEARISVPELARLPRVETAARKLLERSRGRRSATAMLERMAASRAAPRRPAATVFDGDP
jgi:hypothetical protein